jgi:hypothetical protein
MAYYIFLKSLRSQEEFRKNPHVKIPPKSSSTISQSPAIIKNQIIFGKEFSFAFGPIGPAASRPARPLSPASHRPFPLFSSRPHTHARPISACAALAYLPKDVSSSSLRSPATTPSPSITAKRAPTISSIFHQAPADTGHAAASLDHPAPPSLYLEMLSQGVYSPAMIPELTPSLTTPPTFNGVNALTPSVIGHYPLSGAPLAPI